MFVNILQNPLSSNCFSFKIAGSFPVICFNPQTDSIRNMWIATYLQKIFKHSNRCPIRVCCDCFVCDAKSTLLVTVFLKKSTVVLRYQSSDQVLSFQLKRFIYKHWNDAVFMVYNRWWRNSWFSLVVLFLKQKSVLPLIETQQW